MSDTLAYLSWNWGEPLLAGLCFIDGDTARTYGSHHTVDVPASQQRSRGTSPDDVVYLLPNRSAW